MDYTLNNKLHTVKRDKSDFLEAINTFSNSNIDNDDNNINNEE